MPDLTGQTLKGRYHVDEAIGRGGMAKDYVLLRRFAREARVLELLQHPHIVRFFGFEETDKLAFPVMEYVDDLTLRRQLKLLGRPLSLPEALTVLQPVCSALHYAHQMGFFIANSVIGVEVDNTRANIFIKRGGRVLLGDFGIARLSESATVTFSTPGTPAYMAPEQCQGAGAYGLSGWLLD